MSRSLNKTRHGQTLKFVDSVPSSSSFPGSLPHLFLLLQLLPPGPSLVVTLSFTVPKTSNVTIITVYTLYLFLSTALFISL